MNEDIVNVVIRQFKKSLVLIEGGSILCDFFIDFLNESLR